ncbi:hypothetical protein L7F22_005792 [Adiantum nelumboides]|nr:hypothetical protein [Adiantum nelumboides]
MIASNIKFQHADKGSKPKFVKEKHQEKGRQPQPGHKRDWEGDGKCRDTRGRCRLTQRDTRGRSSTRTFGIFSDKSWLEQMQHIPDEVLAQIPAHIFIAKFRDEEGDNIKTTIMPREIWTMHRRPKVASAVRVVHLEQLFKLPPWGTDYMRAHKLMSSIQYDGKAMLTDSDGAKVEVLMTKEIINEALQFLSGAYDLIPKTKAIDNEKAFLKVKGSKFKYSDLIYSERELPLRLISQHFRVQKPPRYTEPFLHMAVVMALCVAERRQVRCDYAKFILESLIEANLKNSAKNKLYMNAEPMLTRVAYQALGMIDDLPAASSQASLIQQAKYVPKTIRMTNSAASSRSTRSKKSSSDEERRDTDKEQDSQESAQQDIPKKVEAAAPLEYKRSDEEDTSTPLEKRSQKPRSREQVLMDEAMTRVEARRKELADARAAKASKTAKPMTMKEARREKHTAEQRAAQLAREKIKEALSRKAEERVLEPTQGSPKRPRQEDEEELEHIQADPIRPSPMNIPPALPSSPITPFPLASTPRTPPSPSPLDLPKSPPAPSSPQQQQFSAEPIEITTSLQEETKQPMYKTEEEEKQTDSEQQKLAGMNLPIPIIQLEEPTNEEAIQEVKSFDYTKLIQTLSSQLTRKEAQNHELIKNEKKTKEQLKYEDARFQKLTASYNTVKTTLTALLQNQKPAAAIPSTSDSASANTLAALQEELQTEKLQRQLLVSGFMSQTVQHEAKVK